MKPPAWYRMHEWALTQKTGARARTDVLVAVSQKLRTFNKFILQIRLDITQNRDVSQLRGRLHVVLLARPCHPAKFFHCLGCARQLPEPLCGWKKKTYNISYKLIKFVNSLGGQKHTHPLSPQISQLLRRKMTDLSTTSFSAIIVPLKVRSACKTGTTSTSHTSQMLNNVPMLPLNFSIRWC